MGGTWVIPQYKTLAYFISIQIFEFLTIYLIYFYFASQKFWRKGSSSKFNFLCLPKSGFPLKRFSETSKQLCVWLFLGLNWNYFWVLFIKSAKSVKFPSNFFTVDLRCLVFVWLKRGGTPNGWYLNHHSTTGQIRMAFECFKTSCIWMFSLFKFL